MLRGRRVETELEAIDNTLNRIEDVLRELSIMEYIKLSDEQKIEYDKLTE